MKMKMKSLLVIGTIMFTMICLAQSMFANAANEKALVALPTPTPTIQMVKNVENVDEDNRVLRENYSDGSWSIQYRGKSAEEVIKELGIEDEVTFISSYTQTAESTIK